MLKLCATSISKPLHILFNKSVVNEWMNECFTDEWEKANIIPVHNQGNKQIIESYLPVSLLTISSKVF